METIAKKNVDAMTRNSYPGRGLVMGLDETGLYAVQVYWVMGRSDKSRNRRFGYEGGRLFTEAADPAKMEKQDQSLIIYNAMREGGGFFVVSNGRQTDDVLSGILRGEDFILSLANHDYEPDSPNFTPRITGVCFAAAPFFGISVLSKSRWSATCDRAFYIYEDIGNGFGFCVTTYSGDGNPLPPFTDKPLLMPLNGDIDTVLNTYWAILNPENRVALAVKFISLRMETSTIKVINRFPKVG